jgi:NAD(P)-dependent dehydrogenase (short-subunit alcohol dehydrogenase family)
VLNISSDAAINAYPGWGAYGSSKAALHHLTRIWNEEHVNEGVHFLSLDPGDMDTPMHAAAMPDADPATLKRPEQAARELAEAIAALLPVNTSYTDEGGLGGRHVSRSITGSATA